MTVSIERRREYALKNQEINERACIRYVAEIRKGASEDAARSIVKKAFDIGDRRLDNLLTSRAGHFTPGSVAQLEAVALRCVGQVEADVQALRSFYNDQIVAVYAAQDAGEEWFDIKITDQTGGRNAGTKTERIRIEDAERRLLEARTKTTQATIDTLRLFKAETIINLGDDPLSQYSTEQLDAMMEAAEKKHKKQVEPNFEVEGAEN